MAGSFLDVLGTLRGYFQIGLGGPKVKNSSGVVALRNSADSADAAATASAIALSGATPLVLNANATESAGSFKTNIAAPTAGMTADLTWTFPSAPGTTGQVLATDGAGNLTLASAGSTSACDKLHSESVVFGSSSPITMFSTGSGDIIDEIEVVVDTPFTGGTPPSLSIGISGTTSKYMAATDVDLTQAATTTFKVHPGLPAQGVEALIATYVANSSSAGAARIITHYSTPAA
jgi:hypothetical protein